MFDYINSLVMKVQTTFNKLDQRFSGIEYNEVDRLFTVGIINQVDTRLTPMKNWL